jgi:putative lysine transport system ATP-binding protein
MIHAELTMRSVALEMDTKVTVLLPEDRHKTEDLRGKKYPVLYILHGFKEDCSAWINLSNIFLMCRDLDLIVVMPSANNSSYQDMVYGQDYYSWISGELPMKLKNYLPITDDREQTFIMGESMGGYGTLRLALAHPERYGKAVCLSGANIIRLGDRHAAAPKLQKATYGLDMDQAMAGDGNLDNLVRKLKDYQGPRTAYRFYCGTEDMVYPLCKQFAEEMTRELPDWDIQQEYWPGQHNFFFWNQAVPKALQFFGFTVEQNSVI